MMSNYLPGSDCQMWMSQASSIQNDGWAQSWTSSRELALKLGADIPWSMWIGPDFLTVQMSRPTTPKVWVLSPSLLLEPVWKPLLDTYRSDFPLVEASTTLLWPQKYSGRSAWRCQHFSTLINQTGLIWSSESHAPGGWRRTWSHVTQRWWR